MATPVKIIPTLHGEAARAFIERAEERDYIEMMKRSGMPL